MTMLYIIHGWTYTLEPWTKTLGLLKKAGIKVKMLKVPGLTTSSRKVWTIAEYVKWADQQIPDGAIALGHSNGGRILLNLLQDRPDKLKHLILLNSAGVYEPPTSRQKIIRSLAKLGAPLKKFPLVRRIFHKISGVTDYAHAPVNMQTTLTNMLASDRELKLEQVTTPATILWGQADKVTPPRQAEVLHAKLPSSTLKFYQNWTHAPYISDPAGLARAIVNTLKEIN